jgi:hypothetical protein
MLNQRCDADYMAEASKKSEEAIGNAHSTWHRQGSDADDGLCSALFLGGGCGEIGVLACHPINEFAYVGVRQQAFHIHPVALQFGIGEVGDERLLANRVHGHDVAAASALGHGMVPNNGLAARPSTKPAGQSGLRNLLLAFRFFISATFRMFAGHAST